MTVVETVWELHTPLWLVVLIVPGYSKVYCVCHLYAHVSDAGQPLLGHLLNGSHSQAIGEATGPERLEKFTLKRDRGSELGNIGT